TPERPPAFAASSPVGSPAQTRPRGACPPNNPWLIANPWGGREPASIAAYRSRREARLAQCTNPGPALPDSVIPSAASPIASPHYLPATPGSGCLRPETQTGAPASSEFDSRLAPAAPSPKGHGPEHARCLRVIGCANRDDLTQPAPYFAEHVSYICQTKRQLKGA